MFQFPGLPSHRLCIHLWILKHYLKCVPAFGNLRINGYLLLPAAYRSLSRPSSAPSAKASALCSLLLDLLLVFSLQPSLSHSFQDKLFSNTHTSVMCGIFYYCFTRSENFLVSRFNIEIVSLLSIFMNFRTHKILKKHSCDLSRFRFRC